MVLSFTERLANGPLLCDGAMGTQLYERGIEDVPLELANLTHPDVVKAVHLDYLRAGAEVIQTNTFGANAVKLADAGAEDRVEEMNRAAVAIAGEARRLVGQSIWIAGGIGPLGRDGSPFGALDAATGHNAFAQQAAVLADAGVDLFMLETFSSLAEVKLAVAAVRSVSPLPIVAQMTFAEGGVTPGGDTPEEVAAALGELDLAAFGANCSVGPDLIRGVVERMARVASLPITAQPNAGLPAYVDGRLEYSAGPAYFADAARQIALAGARLLGGCCGTTPEHIARVRDALRGVEVPDGGARSARPAAAAQPAQPARAAAPPAAPEPSATGLAERIAAGEFVVTAELSPPRGFDAAASLEKLRPIVGAVHAINVTDSPRAQGRMSALAMCSLVQSKLGVETIMHMSLRHRNLLALHSDLLGAHALGVRNVFTVMGDVPTSGDYPQATAVSDITASGLIKLMAGFNRGVDANDRALEGPTSFFIGAALNLNAPDLDRELRVLERKVSAGAHFLLTQPVYEPDAVERVAHRLGGFPLPVLLGVLPLRSVRHARFLHNEVPGISVPDGVFERLEAAGDAAAAEGIALSQELLRAVRGRIAGVYFMPPFERYSVVGETLAGLDLTGA
ncbi:MAG: bifunctional homocysteine S-methyltransferase/methylenetetrahydrofolate reductase [Chloroflexi bacterium]|nr:bifunctional homocysteine S-methyltransferase/methylenetetrahydrofolate reductase [Chloroflexota bacterium]